MINEFTNGSKMAASYVPDVCYKDQVNELLERLSIQFLEMVPIRKMKWKDEETAALVATPFLQQKVLQATVLHPICQHHPPALSYSTRFMKELIHKLEMLDAEICDEVYETYTELLSQAEDDDDTLCYKTYTLPAGGKVHLQESVTLVSQGTTGLSTWQAAQHLAEWVLENQDVFTDKHVIELGCGLGLTGIVTCRSCNVRSYTFTDCHRQVLYLLAKNIEDNLAPPETLLQLSGSETITLRDKKMLQKIKHQLSLTTERTTDSSCIVSDYGLVEGLEDGENITSSGMASSLELEERQEGEENEILVNEENSLALGGAKLEVNSNYWELDNRQQTAVLKVDPRLRIGNLDWEDLQQDMMESIQADVVLAADVVYDTSIIPYLVQLLRQLLQPSPGIDENKKAFVASTVRNEDTRDAFLIALSSEGLSYGVVEGPKQTVFHYDRNVPIEILQITLQ